MRRPAPPAAALHRLLGALGVWGLLGILGVLSGCASLSGEEDGTELTVLAAASLTDVFTEAGEAFEESHPGVRVRLSFAGSQELAAQVRQGVPADVLVTADTGTMDGVAAHTGAPVLIARNAMTIVTPPGNPAGVASLADLGRPGLRLVLAAPEVPAGRYGRDLLGAQDVAAAPVSEEPSVRAVLAKVELGEADAGLVYTTDAAVAGTGVHTVAIPRDANITAAYPAAVLTRSAHPEDAAAFTGWLTTPPAQELLAEAGFAAP